MYVALFKEECADDIHTYLIAVSETFGRSFLNTFGYPFCFLPQGH